MPSRVSGDTFFLGSHRSALFFSSFLRIVARYFCHSDFSLARASRARRAALRAVGVLRRFPVPTVFGGLGGVVVDVLDFEVGALGFVVLGSLDFKVGVVGVVDLGPLYLEVDGLGVLPEGTLSFKVG